MRFARRFSIFAAAVVVAVGILPQRGGSFTDALAASDPVESAVPGESQALATSINGPTDLAWDKDGFLYIVEMVQRRLLRLNIKSDSIKVVLPEPRSDSFDEPHVIAADQKGHLFIADFNGRLRRLDTQSGSVTELLPKHPAPPYGPPTGINVDGEGNLLIDRDHTLFRLRPGTKQLEVVAGSNGMKRGFSGDGAQAANATLHFPMGVAVDKDGAIFIADYENCRIRKIAALTQIITTVAGTGTCASTGDGGPAITAEINYPSSIVIDGMGNLFFVDGSRVRRIDWQGVVTTYAGTGEAGFSGDDGPANMAKVGPSGLAVDEKGNLFIAEFSDNRIRRVDAVSHVITTIAGNGTPHRVDVLL